MEENSKPIFLPKGTDGRYKDISVLHIQGLLLVIVLMVALWASFSILGRSVLSMVMSSVGGSVDLDSINESTELLGMGSGISAGIGVFTAVSKALGVLSYIAAFASLGGSIYILYLMRKRIADIIDPSAPYENPIRVKKAKFVWLGFLLGAYGGHLFALKKKKAWIFLLMGILGMEIIPLFIYTSGISFADAFMACFIEKDEDGYIEIEDYPYWI